MISQEQIIKQLVFLASRSTCLKSRCGSIIVKNDSGSIIGAGFNSPPRNIEPSRCFKDELEQEIGVAAADVKLDISCCVHAEKRAIINALECAQPSMFSGITFHDTTLYFIRLDADKKPVASGPPSCPSCSKMIFDVGIPFIALYNGDGFDVYDALEFHKISCKGHLGNDYLHKVLCSRDRAREILENIVKKADFSTVEKAMIVDQVYDSLDDADKTLETKSMIIQMVDLEYAKMQKQQEDK